MVTKTIRKVPNPESNYKRISHKISRSSYSSLNLVDDNRTMSLKSSNTNKAPPRPTIPQFYFPQGNITSTNSKKRISIMIEKLQSVFNNFPNKNQAGKTDWKAMAKAAQCPFYWKTLLARAASPCTEDEIKLSSIDQPTSPAGSSNGSESGGSAKIPTPIPVKMSVFCDLYEKICHKYTEKSSRFVALISVGRSIRQARSLISPISSPSPTNYNCNNNNNNRDNITNSNNHNSVNNSNNSNNNSLTKNNNNSNTLTTTATATASTNGNTPAAIFQNNIEPKMPNPEDMYIGFNDMRERLINFVG